jgi:hypothetical protein
MHTVNHCSCRKVRRSAVQGLLIRTALVALALPISAHAQFAGKASATAQFENNSNVFAVDGSPAQAGASSAHDSSTEYVYGAAFDGTYQWSRQQLYATASAREYNYQQFSDLNHNEYTIETGLLWKIGDLLDGKLAVARSHVMVPFLDLSGRTEALTLITDQTETLEVGLKLSPVWKLEGSAFTSQTNQPTPGQPNLQLTQDSGTASIEYAGIGPLTSGLTATYSSGDYSGSNSALNPFLSETSAPFTQSTAGFLARYKLSRTSFESEVTYSRRTSSGVGSDNASGLTGLIEFKDQLTPKTGFTVKIDRVINTYYLNLGSELDTDAEVGVTWKATHKLDVAVDYTFTYRAFPGEAQGPARAYPVDYQQYATLTIKYQPQRWLQIAPYANVQTRSSNTYGQNFNSTVYGVTVTASVGETPNRPK